MSHRFYTLDVFTGNSMSGNPLAVVMDCDDLDTETMQKVAQEFNLSETVFLQTPKNPAHTAKVRIFTPQRELPFAGHPTVGTAVLLAEQKFGKENQTEAILVLEEEIGLVRIGTVVRPDNPSYAEFDVPQNSKEMRRPRSKSIVAGALGLVESDIGFDNHRTTNFTAGVGFGFVPVRSLEALARAKPMTAAWADANFGEEGHENVFVYTRAEQEGFEFQARMFAPSMGISEDPATGAAVAAFAGVLEKFESLADGRQVFNIAQGVEMGRPSRIILEMELMGGRISNTRIGGEAIVVQNGEINI